MCRHGHPSRTAVSGMAHCLGSAGRRARFSSQSAGSPQAPAHGAQVRQLRRQQPQRLAMLCSLHRVWSAAQNRKGEEVQGGGMIDGAGSNGTRSRGHRHQVDERVNAGVVQLPGARLMSGQLWIILLTINTCIYMHHILIILRISCRRTDVHVCCMLPGIISFGNRGMGMCMCICVIYI
jgi:hypothetical protein